MPRTPLLCVSLLLLLSFNALSQQQQPAPTDSVMMAQQHKTFSEVEIEASFPGGRDAWVAYLTANLKANTPVKKKAPAGKYMVIVRFIVSKDGNISEVVAETNHGFGMEEEVIRIIKKGPKWNPAQLNGKFVNAYRRQPVTVVVQGR